MKVYKAINAVQAELSSVGITKDRRNMQGSGYNFRGIDDVYNAIAPLLAKHSLCILPRVLTRECVERASKSGGALFYVTVEVDSGDKATNKAMSAAYKYAAFQAFSIPTESDNDADAHTHSVAPKTVLIAPLIASIDAATTEEELKSTYFEAIKVAGHDAAAKNAIIVAKDLKKASL